MQKCPRGSCKFSTKSKQNLLKHISRGHDNLQSAAAAMMWPRKFDFEVAGTRSAEAFSAQGAAGAFDGTGCAGVYAGAAVELAAQRAGT